MDTKSIPLVTVLSLVVLLGMGCQPGDPASGTLLTHGDLHHPAQDGLIPQTDQPLASNISSGQAVDPVAPVSLLEPEEVVEQFLRLHINSVRVKLEGMAQSPVAGFDYDPVNYLSYEFYSKIHATLDEQIRSGGPGFDPIRLAQDLPVDIQVNEVLKDGDLAKVTVEEYWGGNPLPSIIHVYLSRTPGGWRIVDILPEELGVDNSTPSGAVNAFYAWYLHQSRVSLPGSDVPQPIEMLPESPLVTSEFVRAVHEITKSFSDKAGYDPVICAQDIPPVLWAEAEIADDEQSYVLVQSSYPGFFLVVELKNVDGAWKIWNVTCSADPTAAVKAFYTWYLDYIGDPAGEFRNPLVDIAYQDSEYLTDDFIRKVDETLASYGNGGGFDPFLMAQDIPQEIVVEAGAEDGNVVVIERFGDSWQVLEVSLMKIESHWQIDGIQRSGE